MRLLFGPIVLLTIFGLLHCGQAKEENGAVQVRGSEKTEKQKFEAKKQKEEKESVVLKGTGEAKGEGEPVVLTLEIRDGSSVAGELVVNGIVHQVAGALDGAMLRCWVEGLGQTPESTWRGYVIGQSADQKSFEGTFAVSNNGASAVLGGTWTGTM